MAEPEGRLGDSVLRFLGRRVSISVAATDRTNRPFVGRALALRVDGDADGAALTVLVDGRANADLVAAAAATGRLAIVASEPSTHRSIQIKGRITAVAAPTAEDAALTVHHIDRFVDELAGIGFTEPFVRAVCAHDPADLVALHLCPGAVFDQTPGPNAGAQVPP